MGKAEPRSAGGQTCTSKSASATPGHARTAGPQRPVSSGRTSRHGYELRDTASCLQVTMASCTPRKRNERSTDSTVRHSLSCTTVGSFFTITSRFDSRKVIIYSAALLRGRSGGRLAIFLEGELGAYVIATQLKGLGYAWGAYRRPVY